MSLPQFSFSATLDESSSATDKMEASPKLVDESGDCCERDQEQWAAAVEEFQAISDGATQIQPEEMPAYWRILRWVLQQPIPSLRQHASSVAARQEFLHHPNSLRGHLYQFEMEVCRVLPYEIPDNQAGTRKLYEVWGLTPGPVPG